MSFGHKNGEAGATSPRFMQQLSLPATAWWMAATRVGPIGASLAAALALSDAEYGLYVVALAWAGGMVSVVASAIQATAARASGRASQSDITALSQIMQQGLGLTAIVPLVLALVFLVLGFGRGFSFVVATLGLAGAMNACLSSLLWARGRLKHLAIISLVESALVIGGAGVGGLWFGHASAALSCMAIASLIAGVFYVADFGGIRQFWALARRSSSEPSPAKRPFGGIIRPSLLTGVAASAAPALAVLIAHDRAPDSAATYGVVMVVVAGVMFPIQILSIAFARPLIGRHPRERVALGASGLWLGLGWGIAMGGLMILLGPMFAFLGLPLLLGAEFGQSLVLAGWIIGCFCPVAMAGPLVQAGGRYWTWAVLGVISGVAFIGAAYLLPAGKDMMVQACLISAAIRVCIGFPLAWLIVLRWHRQI